MTERKKEALADWVSKGILATAVVAAVWFFCSSIPNAIDRELAIREARTAQHLQMLAREQANNNW